MRKRISGSILCTGIIDGKDGQNGRDGQDGQNGRDGQDGQDGRDGQDGQDGQNGRDGQDGQDGRDAAVLEFTAGNPVLFTTDHNGMTTSSQQKDVTFRVRTAGGVGTPTTANISVTSSFGNISITKPGDGTVHLSVIENKSVSEGTFSVTATATILGKPYTATGCIAVACNRMGLRGDAGPWRYFDGHWDPAKHYNKNAGTPVVLAADGLRYYLNGDSSYNEDPRSNNNGAPWSLTTESFKYLVTEMMFSDGAQFGAFVFNNDWLISSSGTIDGTRYLTTDKDHPASVTLLSGDTVPAYTRFNPDLPDGKMNVPVPSGTISSQVLKSVYFSLRGGHIYKITVKISDYDPSSPEEPLPSIDIYLRTATGTSNLRALTVNRNGSFVLGNYSPSADGDFRVCYVCQNGLTATLDAVTVTSSTVFVPNYAADGSSGEAYLGKCHVRGDVTANKLLTSDANFSTEILPGLVEFRSVLSPLSYLRIGADADGMVFQMTDNQGRLIWNLGGSSNGIGSILSGGGDYTTVYYKSMSSLNPAVSEFNNVTKEDCTEYYQYNGKWASANGERQFVDGEEAKSGIVHTIRTNVPGAYLIPDGYYVKPNNGIFLTEVSNVEVGDSTGQKKTVYIYHFVSGKNTETLSKEFY